MALRNLVVLLLLAGVAAGTASGGDLATPATAVADRAQNADNDVDLLLCLAADASESVSEFEYYLQREGHADAIEDSEVVEAIRGGARGKIAVSYVEWAKPDQQHLGADWQIIDSMESARSFAHKIRNAPAPPWIKFNIRDTSTGDAIRYCLKRFENAPVRASRMIIDISSDGTSNAGGQISHARDLALSRDVVINVLAISRPRNDTAPFAHTRPTGGLVNYFTQNVAGGHGSFVETASSYDAFAAMMRRKFLLEIASTGWSGQVIGRALPR